MRVFLFILFTPLALQAEPNLPCKALQKNGEIVGCLNNWAKIQLSTGSEADRIYQERLNRFLAKYNLSSQNVKTQNLDTAFSILVESQEPKSDRPCFDFESYYSKRNRKKRIEMLQTQIREASLFLAEIHARSWGHQVSLLFPIKEISLCSLEATKRKVAFQQRTLHLGMGSEPIKAFEIMEAWNSGTPIRSSHLSWYNSIPYLGKKLRDLSSRDNPEQLLRDKIAENWLVLNPTGNLRTTALYTLAESLVKIKGQLGSDDTESIGILQKRQLLLDTIRGPGFSRSDVEKLNNLIANDVDQKSLFNLWRQKIFNPQNILLVMENAIGDQARQNANLHLVLRKINAGVAVVNDKNIIVRIEQLMANSIKVSNFDDSSSSGAMNITVEKSNSVTTPSGQTKVVTTKIQTNGMNTRDLTLNADEINAGVAIDLIDNVIVSVQIPNISPATYKRVCLFQALEEYIPSEPSPAAK